MEGAPATPAPIPPSLTFPSPSSRCRKRQDACPCGCGRPRPGCRRSRPSYGPPFAGVRRPFFWHWRGRGERRTTPAAPPNPPTSRPLLAPSSYPFSHPLPSLTFPSTSISTSTTPSPLPYPPPVIPSIPAQPQLRFACSLVCFGSIFEFVVTYNNQFFSICVRSGVGVD